ncbi:DUF455-domain-containing protein [Ramaria rubella]|nr:DUF455-domain-containing protein [Ramaria rubella]
MFGPATFLRLATLSQLSTHTRFLFTLRSESGVYHSLLLFRLSGSSEDELSLYVMESACPHLGADLSHAEIEECGLDVVAVCPWHRYDFNLNSGASETGLKACTYAVEIRPDQNDGGEVWVEAPEDGKGWEVVELRPVSEAFADPPPALLSPEELTISPVVDASSQDPLVPSDNEPRTLIEWAVLILNTPDPDLKVQRTRHAVTLFRTGKLQSVGKTSNAPAPPAVPPRHAGLQTVDPGKVGKRGKAGSLKSRIAMLHALANIEQWAIDLAWDIIARFGPLNKDLPLQFFSDFTKVALDESKHFSLLSARLVSLSSFYGSHPIHAALWESATATSASLAARLAIIHLVHEARGLDVNPNTIAKFRVAGDAESVAVLEIIHLDEITHVTAGHRWFTWVCEREGYEPIPRFRAEVKLHFGGKVKGPFNEEDRRKAGLTKEFYENLRGEAWDTDETKSPPRVPVEYGK